MRSFDFYEFAGVVAPGAVALLGITLVHPELLHARVNLGDITVGGFGVFAILAYVAGHLVQGLGNAIEWAWWRLWGGLPTDWVRTSRHQLLAMAQVRTLEAQLGPKLGLLDPPEISSLDARAWFGITRQIYAAVQGAGRANRVDVFNGNYGLFRGVAAALVVVVGLELIAHRTQNRIALVIGLVTIGLALYRMHRFGRHYGQEVFMQFLQLPLPK